MDETLRTTELWLVCVHPKEEVRGRCYGDKKEVKVNGWHSKKTQVKHTKLVSFYHDQFLHHWPHSGFGQVVIFNRNVSPNSGFSDQTLSARWGRRFWTTVLSMRPSDEKTLECEGRIRMTRSVVSFGRTKTWKHHGFKRKSGCAVGKQIQNRFSSKRVKIVKRSEANLWFWATQNTMNQIKRYRYSKNELMSWVKSHTFTAV